MGIKTYKGRTEEEQKEYNAQRKAYFKSLKEKSLDGHATIDDETGDFSIDINPVVEQVVQPKLSLKDRVLAKLSREDVEDSDVKQQKNKEHAVNSYKLISHAIPMALSALFTIYAKKMFTDDYKKCAPTRDEISTVLLPIFSIISRMVEIETKASQNAIDAAAAIMAAITVGTRMLMTAEEIKNNAGNNANINTENPGTNYQRSNNRNSSGNSQAESDRIVRGYFGANGSDNRGSIDSGSDGNVDGANGPVDDRTYEAALVADLLKRDTIGRRQMGLAPRIV